jgi:monoamine oxidase
LETLPCGVLNKIGLSFKDNTFSANDTGWHIVSSDYLGLEPYVGSFDININGGQQVIAFVGGSEAEYFEKKGEADAVAYATKCVEQTFGSNIKKNINGYICSAWAGDSLTFGSYSYAKPGGSASREVLNQVLADRIYFAGEATSVNHFGTVHGAYFSGIVSANKILNSF